MRHLALLHVVSETSQNTKTLQ